MNAQSKIVADQTNTFTQIMDFSDLYLSDLNPRQTVDDSDAQLMADSLIATGLLQNLAGLLDDNGKAGIVAGGRRLRGLALAIKERPELAKVPVKVTNDKALAQQWASTENLARQSLDAADEIRAYGNLAAQNKKVGDIARCFGVTEKRVYKLLKLANLPAPVLDALKAQTISIDVAQCMTVSNDEHKTLEALDLAIENRWAKWDAERFFREDTISGTDYRARYIGDKAYKKAGGLIIEDLFNESQLWQDPDLLQQLFITQLELDAEEFRSGVGFAWVETSAQPHVSAYGLEEQLGYAQMAKTRAKLTADQETRYNDLVLLKETTQLDATVQTELDELQSHRNGIYTADQKQHSGLVVFVKNDGTIDAVQGLVRPADREAAEQLGYLPKTEQKVAGAKSDYAQAFVEDMDAIAKGSLQAKLLENPDLVLDLVAFSLSELVSYDVPIGIRLNTAKNVPSQADGHKLPKAIDDEHVKSPDWDRKDDLAERFTAFRKRGQKARDTLLIEKFARAMGTGSKDPLFALLKDEINSDMRQVWTPSETNCFKRLKATLLDAAYQDVMGLKADDGAYKTFVKLKKAEKAKALHKLFNDKKHQKALKLSDEQIERIQTWVPNC